MNTKPSSKYVTQTMLVDPTVTAEKDLVSDDKGMSECILCKISVPDTDDEVVAHLVSKMHKEAFIKKLMIQESIKFNSSGDLYCYICGVAFDDLMSHIETKEHEKQIRTSKILIKKDGDNITMPDGSTDLTSCYCKMCNFPVQFSFHEISEHCMSTMHKKAREIEDQPFNGIFSVYGCDEFLFCKLCRDMFGNYVELLFSHVDESIKHHDSLQSLLRLTENEDISIVNYLSMSMEDKAMCNRCNIKVPCTLENMSAHIKGKQHQNGKM